MSHREAARLCRWVPRARECAPTKRKTAKTMKETSVKPTPTKKRGTTHPTGTSTTKKNGSPPGEAPRGDRMTLIALYLFVAGMALALLYFISLIFVT